MSLQNIIKNYSKKDPLIDITNLKKYRVDLPNEKIYFIHTDFATLPNETQDQIIFLDDNAKKFLHSQFSVSFSDTGSNFSVDLKDGFKNFNKIDIGLESKKSVKKWLHERGIKYSKWVYVLPCFSYSPVVAMTWKMVIKYSDTLFNTDDFLIFDDTKQWCLFYSHTDTIYFGQINIYDSESGYDTMESWNERKRKYPNFKHPLYGD
ncbi:MAG: hypothetical protein V3U80_08240 [Flavobacteriaceae bacterium]